MVRSKARTAKDMLEQISADSEGMSGLVTSPFGALNDLVCKNAATILDPDHCDGLVSQLLNNGKSTISKKVATKLLSVADLSSLITHPYFVRAAARRGASFYISANGSVNKQTHNLISDTATIELNEDIDPNFFIEPEWFPYFSKFVERGLPVLLIGPPGTGKTEAVERLFAKRDQRLEIISCTPAMTADDFEGVIDLRDGNTIFTPSACAEAVKNGHGLLLDEVDTARPEAAYSLYRILDGKDMRIARKGYAGMLSAHKNFRVVGTQNTEGRGDDRGIHHGRMFQDEAFLDRWSNYIRIDYLPPDTEALVLSKRTGIPKKKATMIVKVATELRRALSNDRIMLCASMRRTLAVAANIAAGFIPEDAWRYAVQNRATSADQQDIDDFVNRIYGTMAKKR
jgi:MoxR-like ATPase